jgi:flagellum-specific ATP synthase
MNTLALTTTITRARPIRALGRIDELTGSILAARSVQAALGEHCLLLSPSGRIIGDAVVVGFRQQRLLLAPFDHMSGIAPGCMVEPTGAQLGIPLGPGLLGRAIDALGNPVDGRGSLERVRRRAVESPPPEALSRPRIDQPLITGIRAIDAAITIGKGQRMGVFAGSGVGKSTLLGMLARGTAADVSVIALIGERGREAKEFVDEILGAEGLERSVLVITTSDEPAIRKVHAAAAASRIAEFFRDQGLDVLLLMDSITRVAMAEREIGLAAGQPPTTRGYTPSVFALIPRLLERAGRSPRGSITGIYTVLVEGDDMDEPVADHMRSILDGHIVLSRALAHRNQYPAIDLLASTSRVMSRVVNASQLRLAGELRRTMATYAEVEDLVRIGAYRAGTSPEVDRAVRLDPKIRAFLTQGEQERSPLATTTAELARILAFPGDKGVEA